MRKNIEWKNGALSPVLFFVDDLTNRWVDLNSDGKIQPEEDFGYACFDENGAVHYLKKEILSVNPEIKVTFFLCVGPRADEILNSKIKSLSLPINYDAKSKEFFKMLAENPNFELAYHGITHGIPGERLSDFVQEWQVYKNLEEARQSIAKGKEIFRDTVGHYPNGGKYGGYVSNAFSDESIDKSGFKWWCRYFNWAAVKGGDKASYCGSDRNSPTAFNIKFFGENRAIDVPTTLPGNFFNSVLQRSEGIRGFVGKSLRPVRLRELYTQIDFMLRNNLIISIQEHISPARVDGKRQTPNIFDDKDSLIAIFKYLQGKNVWYCTASELAEWVKNRR